MENITNPIDKLAWVLFFIFLGVNIFMFGRFIVYAVIAFLKKYLKIIPKVLQEHGHYPIKKR